MVTENIRACAATTTTLNLEKIDSQNIMYAQAMMVCEYICSIFFKLQKFLLQFFWENYILLLGTVALPGFKNNTCKIHYY